MLNRIGAIALTLAVILALALSAASFRSATHAEQTRALTSARILERIATEVADQTALRTDLEQNHVAEKGTSPTGAYLTNIRRDGLSAHAEMRHKLGSVSKSNVAILTLLDLYEPYAQSENFKTAASDFRTYAIAWNDRWDSVMEYFMAGGNLPASDVPFPADFVAAIEAEKKLASD